MPPAGSVTTGATSYTPTRSVQDLIRGQHTCLVAEIFLEPLEPQIALGASPANSDKLAQRNLTIVDVASPNQAPTTFDIKATPLEIAPTDTPDELMIDWGSLPVGSQASIYLPAASADEILALAGRLYRRHELTRSDPHTIRCLAQGLTYVPVPAADSNYAGLLTVELPTGVKRDAIYRVVVRQGRNVTAPVPQLQPSPPRLQSPARRRAAGRGRRDRRHVGADRVAAGDRVLPAEHPGNDESGAAAAGGAAAVGNALDLPLDPAA
jgi:hypothetical protein